MKAFLKKLTSRKFLAAAGIATDKTRDVFLSTKNGELQISSNLLRGKIKK